MIRNDVFRTIIILVTRGGRRLHFKIPIFIFAAAFAHAHELNVSTRAAGPSVIVTSTYAGTDPVKFAKVQVYSPAVPRQQFQAANTDRRGYFSFVPDTTGSWRVIVDDELGHRREVSVNVAVLETPEAQGNPSRRLERALLGISLLFGLTGFWYGYQADAKIRSQMRP